jgi:hypothetical protein
MTIQHIDLMPRLSLILRPAFLWLTDCHRYRTLLLRSSQETADPSTTPRISWQDWWRWRTSCGFPDRKPHTWLSLAPRSRKSGVRSG